MSDDNWSQADECRLKINDQKLWKCFYTANAFSESNQQRQHTEGVSEIFIASSHEMDIKSSLFSNSGTFTE